MSDGYIGRGPIGAIEDILKDVLTTTPLKYRGTWTPNTFYNQYDVVLIAPKKFYICMGPHRSGNTFEENNDKFDIFTSSFLVGDEFDITVSYLDGETVLYNGSLYICKQDSLGNLPTDIAYWDILVSDLGRQLSNQVEITGGTAYFDELSAGNLEITGDLVVNGTISTGTGTNIDQVLSLTKSLTLTQDWQDVGINGPNLATGTYIIQLYANDGIANNNDFYSGTMSWYAGAVNSTTDLPTDEIILHRAGAGGDAGLYLRTYRSTALEGGQLKLQMYSNVENPSSSNYVFKFRRIM
jgi:hypothetical protein